MEVLVDDENKDDVVKIGKEKEKKKTRKRKQIKITGMLTTKKKKHSKDNSIN